MKILSRNNLKNWAMDNIEQLDEEIIGEISDVEKSAWERALAKIEAREMKMSFSKVKQFAESPFHFMRYMIARELRKDAGTPAMVFGDLVDCLTLTPDETEQRFIIEPDGGAMNSLKGCDALLEFYGLASEEYPKLDDKKRAIVAAREMSGKRIVSADTMAHAQAMRNRLYLNAASGWILSNVTNTQVKAEFSAFGWDWMGKLDGEGNSLIMDLKIMPSANPRKAEYTIRDMKYNWQGALYTLPRGGSKSFYNVIIDRSLGVSCFEHDRRGLQSAWFEVEECIEHFERCIYLGLDNPSIWFSSYDFFARRGIYQYGKR